MVPTSSSSLSPPFLSLLGQPAGMGLEDGVPLCPFKNEFCLSWLTHLPRTPEKDDEIYAKGRKGPGRAAERK